VRFRIASDIGIAARWWTIMSLMKSMSALSGGILLKRSISCGEAIPGIGPFIGWSIHAIAGTVPVIGKPHDYSQPCMMLIWACWVREMSEANSLKSSLSVLSRTLGLVAYYLGHLHSLVVVNHHVASEASLGGVVAGGPGDEQGSSRASRDTCEQDEHQDDDVPASLRGSLFLVGRFDTGSVQFVAKK
jgi:hypothetical protein